MTTPLEVETLAARADCGVVNPRCVSGTCGGAWEGVVQALAGCTEYFGPPMAFDGGCAISAC